jgi:hypothetical protein
MRLSALAAESKSKLGPTHVHVAVLQCGEAERIVHPRVLLIANSKHRGVEDPDHGRQNLLARQPGPAQVGLHSLITGRASPKDVILWYFVSSLACRHSG